MDKNIKTLQASAEILMPAEYKEMRIRAICVEPNMNSFESKEKDVRPGVTNDGESNNIVNTRRANFPIITDGAYITDAFDSEYYY